MSSYHQQEQNAAIGRIGADRMALGLPIAPDATLGDMAEVKRLRNINTRLLNVLCDVIQITTMTNQDPLRVVMSVTKLNDRMIATIREARGLPPLE